MLAESVLINNVSSVSSQKESFDELLSNFSSALSYRNRQTIKAMWEGNFLLQAWYSGEYVNFGTADVPDFQVISLNALVNNFKAALASQTPDIIKAMWERNSLLQAWYTGQYVNYGTADVPDFQVISLNALVNNFKAALASHCKDIIEAIWKRDLQLQAWYSGQYVNFGTTDVPDLRIISLDELVNNFKAALASHCKDIIKVMWKGNVLLQAWYRGQRVNFGKGDAPDFQSISLDALINNFKAALASRASDIIKAMWEGNPLLQAWYNGQYVNFGTADVPDLRVISLDALINNFKAALASRAPDIIKAIWERNPQLPIWYSGLYVNFGTTDVPDLRIISLDELVNNFKAALASHCKDIIKAIWEGNSQLQAWYNGQYINFGTADVPDLRVISLDELVNNFKAVLASHCKDIIKVMWERNSQLQAWYSGQYVNYGTADLPDFRVISVDELVNDFKAVLASHCKDIIKVMWKGNLLLQAWYSGQRINFGTADVPDLQVISVDELVNNFKAVLASHCKDIIKAMWNENTALHNAIEECALENAVSILKKVLASSQNGNSLFIRQYVGWITNREVINAVLTDIINSCKNKKPSTYKANQIQYLENRLSTLLSSPSEISRQDSFPSDNTNIIPIASVGQEITTSKLKRKRTIKSQLNKKSKKQTKTLLSSLVEYAPSKARPQRVENLHDTQLNTSRVSNQPVNNSAVLFNDLDTVDSATPTSSTLFFNEQRLANRQTYLPLNLQPSPVSSPTLFRHNCYQQKIYTFFPIFHDSSVDESSISNQSRLFINL